MRYQVKEGWACIHDDTQPPRKLADESGPGVAYGCLRWLAVVGPECRGLLACGVGSGDSSCEVGLTIANYGKH